jgi:hypothetical protein
VGPSRGVWFLRASSRYSPSLVSNVTDNLFVQSHGDSRHPSIALGTATIYHEEKGRIASVSLDLCPCFNVHRRRRHLILKLHPRLSARRANSDDVAQENAICDYSLRSAISPAVGATFAAARHSLLRDVMRHRQLGVHYTKIVSISVGKVHIGK